MVVVGVWGALNREGRVQKSRESFLTKLNLNSKRQFVRKGGKEEKFQGTASVPFPPQSPRCELAKP